MKTDEQLKQIAKDLYTGLIFTSHHLSKTDFKNMAHLIFMPLVFMTEEQSKELKHVSLIYEYLDQAGPRAINGYPMFMSMNYLTKDEHKKLLEYYKKVKSAMDSI